MKHTTLAQLALALGKHANVSAREKNGKQRLYFKGLGYNTKKMSTSAFIELRDGNAIAHCYIDCPSQHSSWISSQQDEVVASMQRYVRYIRMFFDFGVTGESIEVVMNNAILDAESVKGYFTEWRQQRVAINRFGKLATRNRQFVIAFEGTKNTAPRGFMPLSDAGYNELKNGYYKGCQMLEPYAPVPDYDAIAQMKAKQPQNN
jgi:hypothetical protein